MGIDKCIPKVHILLSVKAKYREHAVLADLLKPSSLPKIKTVAVAFHEIESLSAIAYGAVKDNRILSLAYLLFGLAKEGLDIFQDPEFTAAILVHLMHKRTTPGLTRALEELPDLFPRPDLDTIARPDDFVFSVIEGAMISPGSDGPCYLR